MKKGFNYFEEKTDLRWVKVSDLVCGDELKIANHSGLRNYYMLKEFLNK